MWGKKKLIIVSLLATVVILSVGLIGGAAYAASGTSTATTTEKTLVARVATILGIDQTKLEAAFTQAQRDMQNEALTSQLKSLVDAGTITQAQADAYKTWVQSEPSLPAGLGLDSNLGFPGGQHGAMPGPGENLPAAFPPATSTK